MDAAEMTRPAEEASLFLQQLSGKDLSPRRVQFMSQNMIAAN